MVVVISVIEMGKIIKTSTGINDNNGSYRMMAKHCLRIKVFDKYDKCLFNHISDQYMHTSQMINLCTKLIKHLNLISQTNELKIQKALGTLEEMIIAQLIPSPSNTIQYSSWNLQKPSKYDTCHEIGAVAIIQQNDNDIFTGQLIDDYINTSFQLK